MKLEFQLLIVDDNPNAVTNATGLLKDHLEARGFTLKCHAPDDISRVALKALAGRQGANFDLVAIDYNLGRSDTDGATTAAQLRLQMPYTDMVFYSSDPQINLARKLADADVTSVFIANRLQLDEALIGLADTVIGKAVDLNHMRGIAIAEVADMDVLMEEVVERAFSSADPELIAKGKESLEKLLGEAEKRLVDLRKLVEAGAIIEVVTNGLMFSSMERYKAIARVAACLVPKPAEAIDVLKDFNTAVLGNRNTLAHAKAETAADGTVTLRAIKRGKPPILIDDSWMVLFRSGLHRHRAALATVCEAIDARAKVGNEQAEQC